MQLSYLIVKEASQVKKSKLNTFKNFFFLKANTSHE